MILNEKEGVCDQMTVGIKSSVLWHFPSWSEQDLQPWIWMLLPGGILERHLRVLNFSSLYHFIVSCVPSDGRNESFEDANTSITVISTRLCSRAVHLSHKRLNTSVMFKSLVTSVLTLEVRLPRQDPDRPPDGPVGSAPARWPPPNVCISLSRTDRWSTCSWCPRNDRRNQTCQREQTHKTARWKTNGTGCKYSHKFLGIKTRRQKPWNHKAINDYTQMSSYLSPQFLSSENVSGAEEGDAREAQVLVQHEHTHRDDVGVAQVVYEAADVTIVSGINTVHFTILWKTQLLQLTKIKLLKNSFGMKL